MCLMWKMDFMIHLMIKLKLELSFFLISKNILNLLYLKQFSSIYF